ncbi:MarR family winged helix-turn-helix transcriptional regulator [Cryptosporangium arvum]|uniref:Transcriptional regulator n=1 Tax=Cryptosporangium arvum DSM 44712 TaxID=927661 RepID=A0A010YRZ4_9ACTN|nr:MarR family transcriptional regulator [Cryptosporangium arvum]EXG82985.1 transcriptional regulator [Cryptosporangium arvum DSM 44712]
MSDDEEFAGVFGGITRLGNAIRRGRLEERAMQRSGIELDRPALTILITLQTADQPLRIGEIATRMQVVGPHVTRLLPDLEKRGLVQRVVDPDDQRARLIATTDEGTRTVQRYLGTVLGWMRESLADWSAEDRATLLTLLQRFADDFAARVARLDDEDDAG